jgi:hypothetical protein
MPSFSLILREDPQIGDADLADVTQLFSGWRHCLMDNGGCWFAEGFADQGDESELVDFFQTNLGRRIICRYGGVDVYEGQITEMEIDYRGTLSRRSMEDLVNSVKMLYTKVGDNEVANPSVETTAWANRGSPSTNERSSAWSARGNWSQHIITTSGGQGAYIDDGDITGLDVTAGVSYECTLVINIISGTWRLQVYQTEGAQQQISNTVVTEAGRHSMRCNVPETNDYTGKIEIRITAAAGGAECYADAAVFRVAGEKAETEWITDDDSIARYGQIQMVFLESEMTDDEANSNAYLALAENAWVRTRGPSSGSSFRIKDAEVETYVVVTLMGLYWTCAWTYLEDDLGSGDASVAVTALVDLTEFFSSADALIETNTAEVQLYEEDSIPLSEALEKVFEVGDGSGGAWVMGVWPDKQFRYYARPTELAYVIQGEEMRRYPTGAFAPPEITPGWALNLDLLAGNPEAGAQEIDDPRWVYMSEVWFVYEGGAEFIEWNEAE